MNYYRFFLTSLLLKYSTSLALGNGLAPLENMTKAIAGTSSDLLHNGATIG